MNWKNTLTESLNLDYPFVQAPMLGITTPEMVAAVSNHGALGSLPVGGLPPGKVLELIRKTKSLTNKSFAVNLFANTVPASVNADVWNRMQALIQEFCERNQLPFQPQAYEGVKFFSYEDQVEILLNENIPVVSFTFGVLNNDIINALHEHKASLIGTATSVDEASLLAEKGID